MRTILYQAPYKADGKFNPLGDYDKLVLHVTQKGDGPIHTEWQLESSLGATMMMVTSVMLPDVLETFFLQNATQSELPNRHSKN